MILTENNYYSNEANWSYMSVSQYKQFMTCEAAAMAQLKGEWEPESTTALLVGSYVDAWFEGTLSEFTEKHPNIYKRDGSLKADFAQAEQIIERVQQDELFMEYMGGKKQEIRTGKLFGVDWKIKIDSLHPDKIVDLKVMRTMDRIMGKSFVEHWQYDLQMAVYSAIEGNNLETYLAVVTKETPSDLDIIHVPEWRRRELLSDLQRNILRIISVKNGIEPPERCGVCPYCRATKKLTEPIDFEMVGFSERERKSILGQL